MNVSGIRHTERLSGGLVLLLGLLLPICGSAAEERVALSGTALGAAELDAVRGGYADHDGLRLSFDLERRVYVNGNMESRTYLYGMGPQGQVTGAPADFSTVLQNNLDHQQLRTVTLLEVRMTGYDPVAVTRFEALNDSRIFSVPR
jgi:hypothetical protein